MTARRKQWTDYLAVAQVQPPLVTTGDIPVQPKRRRPGTVRRHNPPEIDIQRAILRALSLHPEVARIERINVMAGRLVGKDGKPSRFIRSCARGRVDLDGVSRDGRVIAIEVKRPSSRRNVTQEQRAYLDLVASIPPTMHICIERFMEGPLRATYEWSRTQGKTARESPRV